jgi:hypothetical protein
MNIELLRLNLLLGWLWVLAGFASGLALGLFFHQEKWLGGYSSFKRRLYRLAHISFFGLGAVNLLFFVTAREAPVSNWLVPASWAMVLGALTMPVCCVLMAHVPRARLLFAIPVSSLLLGGGLTLGLLWAPPALKSGRRPEPVLNHQTSIVKTP